MTNFSLVHPAEKLLLSMLFWLVASLGAGTLLTLGYLFYFRLTGRPERMDTEPLIPVARPAARRNARSSSGAPEQPSSPMAEKLGQKIVNWLIEVTASRDRGLVLDRIQKIRAECERLSQIRNLPRDNKKIVSTVAVWAKKFDVDRHVRDLKVMRYSSQIIYNEENRDFKLVVSGD